MQRIKDLSAEVVDVTAIDTDWEAVATEAQAGYGHPWFWDTAECDNGHAPTLCLDGHGECPDCQSDVYCEGPMMNARWPLGRVDDPEGLAVALAEVGSVCLVKVDDDYAIAMIGGGMDLSWELAHAYVVAGFLPPSALRLPAMAGLYLNRQRNMVIGALAASHRVQVARARRGLSDLVQLRAELRRPRQKRAA